MTAFRTLPQEGLRHRGGRRGDGIGNGLPLPAGPLRAPLSAQWAAVHAILVIGRGVAGEAVASRGGTEGEEGLFREPVSGCGRRRLLRGKQVLAFAGIGRPEKFFETLRGCATVVRSHAFADHHPFGAADLARLREEAETSGLQAVTTEKDLVRIAGADLSRTWPDLMALPVRLALETRRPSAISSFAMWRSGASAPCHRATASAR